MTPPFPILRHRSTPSGVPVRSLPWSTVEPWRGTIERNHGQSLEQLAMRGGLSPLELYLGAHGIELRHLREHSQDEAERWLIGIQSERNDARESEEGRT